MFTHLFEKILYIPCHSERSEESVLFIYKKDVGLALTDQGNQLFPYSSKNHPLAGFNYSTNTLEYLLLIHKWEFDFCFTPSSHSLHFAIRKISAHYFGVTSDWVRYAHTASYAKSKKIFKKRQFFQRKILIIYVDIKFICIKISCYLRNFSNPSKARVIDVC